MEGVELARRKVLQAAVAALCVEAGFITAEKDAMGTLSEILESYITELGRTSRMYSELAQRTEPTLSDVHKSLIDSGVNITSLPDYAKRPQRRHLHRQSKSYQPPQPKVLQVGAKAQRPTNIPNHLPAFPDPHTYVRTPTFAVPSADYKVVREKMATQKRNSRKGLSTLLAKTHPSQPVAGEKDPYGVYTVMKAVPPDRPIYLQALMPSAEDALDTTDKDGSEVDDSSESQKEDSQGDEKETTMDVSLTSSERAMETSLEAYENPYLKPAKRMKHLVKT